MSNQEKRQQSVRGLTGTAYTYNDDWMALFTAAGITSGTYNERLLVWINARLSTAYTTLPDAMRAYAINQGVPSWNEMGTFSPGIVAALSLDFLSGALDPRITFSRPSLATIYDSTGKLTYAPNNLLLQSQNFSTSWSVTNATRTAGITDPLGGTTATQVDFTSLFGNIAQFLSMGAGNYIQSIWVRGDTSGTISLTGVSGGSWLSQVPVTTSWARVAVPFTFTGSAESPGVQSRSGDLTRVYIAFAQLEHVTYQTTPSTYNATTSAAYYGPRFDYNPATLVARGLLIEEARTNICLQSNAFSTSPWILAGTATLTPNSGISPDGTNNAWQLSLPASIDRLAVTISGTTASGIYSGHIYAKLASSSPASRVRFTTNNNLAWGTGLSTALTLTSEWQRVVLSGVLSNTTDIRVNIGRADVNGSDDPTCAGNVLIAFAGVELGSFATSYIPTAASAVARSADSALMTGTNFSNWYNQGQGTFVVAGDVFGAIGSELPTFVNVNDTTLSNYIRLNAASTYRLRQFVNAGGSQQTQDTTGSAPVLNQQFKFGAAYNLNDFAVVADGGAVTTDATGTVPTVTQVNFGVWFGSAGTFLNGHIASLAYYNTRLPNATLQSLTT